MTRVAVVQDYLGVAAELADWSRVQSRASVDFLSDPLPDEDVAAAALREYDIVCAIRERLPLTESLLDRLPNLRLFVAASETNRVIDFAAAEERGVQVVGTPSGGYARAATAELAWGLVLAANRGIVAEDRAIREGRWQSGVFPSLHGRTMGLVGLGGTGRYVARFAREFGMHVLAWSPNLTPMAAIECAAEAVPLDVLLERSDVVSLHMVLSERTHRLLDASRLALMKSDAVLVNTSRGGLIDESALVDTLRARRLRGVALDVFESEPLSADHPLLTFDNVILSPHAAGFTQETYREWYQGTADAVLAHLEGRAPAVLHRRT